MKVSALVFFLVLTSMLAMALPLQAPGSLQANQQKGILALEFTKLTSKRSLESTLGARDSTSPVLTLRNDIVTYIASFELGTPGQPIDVILDSGSSDLWVISADNANCQNSGSTVPSSERIDCKAVTVFDSTKSTTYRVDIEHPLFGITYLDGSTESGTWALDKMTFGDSAILPRVRFGLGTRGMVSNGIFGVGLVQSESTALNGGYTYANVPQLLVDENLTQANAYSIYLNALDDQTGTILFGGVNHQRYDGLLGLVPLVNADSPDKDPINFSVILSSVTFTPGSAPDAAPQATTVQSGNMPILLDTGASLCSVPTELFMAMAEAVGAVVYGSSAEELTAETECAKVKNTGGSVDFDFSGVTIRVPLDELWIQNSLIGIADPQGHHLCQLGLMATESMGDMILGDTFLRSAYLVFDLDHRQVALAQAVMNQSSNEDDVDAISDSIPNASSAPYYSNTQFGTLSFHNVNSGFFGSSGTAIVKTTAASASASASASAIVTASATVTTSASETMSATSTAHCFLFCLLP